MLTKSLLGCALAITVLSGVAECGEFKRVEQFPQGKQTEAILSAILSGFELGNRVERTYAAPAERVWAAAKRSAEELEKVGKREIANTNERTMRIQVGKITQDAAAGLGTTGWLDEFTIEATKVSDTETKVVVSRRVVQPILKQKSRSLFTSGYDRELRSAKSNGEIENWLHTKLEDELTAMASRPAEPATTAPDAQPKTDGGPETQLQKLRELKEKNLISEDEYQAMRKRVLEGVVAPK